MKRTAAIALFCLIAAKSYAQKNLLKLYCDSEYSSSYAKSIYADSAYFHTSIRPYLARVGKEPVISASKKGSFLQRKLCQEHLIRVKDSDYSVSFDFLPDFQAGYAIKNKSNTWINTRGFRMQGVIGKQLTFDAQFYENQGVFADYLTSYITSNGVVPGQGYARAFGSRGFDYGYASGLFSYSPSKHFNVQFGHGKNFIGDGYRSLLLSDFSFNYPFLKITTDLGRVRYMNLYAEFQDLQSPKVSYDLGFRKKYGTFHYFDWLINKHLSLGLFEAIIWQAADSNGYRGFDINYLNPIIFYRPVEFSVGSPDNALMGLNVKWKLLKNISVYGQGLLDEFKLSEYKDNKGWWGNKYGYQIGLKAFDLFGVKNLYVQNEYNAVRPYTYSQRTTLLNYAHYDEALAHPLGANFRENVSIVQYDFHRWRMRFQFNRANYGIDSTNNAGKNIFRSYNSRDREYDNHIGQGINTNLYYAEMRVGYLINSKTNLRIELGYTHRIESNALYAKTADVFVIGLRSSFRALYSDF